MANRAATRFSFTIPSDWGAPAKPVAFNGVMKFSDGPYVQDGNAQFKALGTSKFGQDADVSINVRGASMSSM